MSLFIRQLVAVAATYTVLGTCTAAASNAGGDGALPEVLDLDQAAALLRAAPTTVRQLAEANRLPGRRIGDEWRFSHAKLIEWLGGRDVTTTPGPTLDQHPAVPGKPSVDPSDARRATGAANTASSQASSSSRLPTVGERPSAPTAAEVALRDQGLLLSPGARSVDVKLAYSHGTSEVWSVLRHDQRSLDALASLRYGLQDGLQVTARMPATWQRTTSSGSVGSSNTSGVVSDHYASDASLSLFGVALREGVNRPNLVWSLDAVLPTGPGDRGLGAALVLSKTYDPAVIFASISYMLGQRPDPSAPRRSLARNNVGLSAGYTYALNDALAMSTVLVAAWRDDRATDATTLAPPREREELQFGLTLQLARGLFAEPGVSMRLGGAGADFGASLNMSYSF